MARPSRGLARDDLLRGVETSDRSLGMGSFGCVFQGSWDGRKVAVKCLHPTMMGLDMNNKPSKAYIRFIDEFRILRTLSHPSLVQVYGMAPPRASRESHGLVMEYLPFTLKDRYSKSPPFDTKQEITIAVDVCSGVKYLHSRGILHRDITTSNIMLSEQTVTSRLRAKITDFGLAHKLRDMSLEAQTMSADPGASIFMAPETFDDTRPGSMARYGKRADVFSMGVSILCMCTKQEPANLPAIIRRGRRDHLEKMGSNHPLRALVELAIAIDPDRRPVASDMCTTLVELQRIALSAVNSREDVPVSGVYSAREPSPERPRSSSVSPSQLVPAEDDPLQNASHQEQAAVDSAGVQSTAESVQQASSSIQPTAESVQQASSSIQPTAEFVQEASSSIHLDADLLQSDTPAGVLERCRQLFTADGVVPTITSVPEWQVVGHFPKGTTSCCYMPCIHDGYIYAALTTSSTPCLWKIPLHDLSLRAWERDELPLPAENWKWFSRCYFFSYNGFLHFVGRKLDGSPISIWKRCEDIWEQLVEFTSLTNGWQDFGIVVFKNNLVMCGGRKNGRPDRSLCVVPLDTPGHHIKFPWPDLPAACYSPSLMVYNGQLCATGSVSHRDFYVLHEEANMRESHWVREEEKQTPHYRCAVTVVNNQLVAVGGYDYGRIRHKEQGAAYVYHEAKKLWKKLPSLNAKRRRPYILTTPDKIVVLSGCELNLLQCIVPEIEVLALRPP